MNERFIEWLLTNPHFSRRGVVHTPLKAAAAFGIGYSISETAKFIFPQDEKFGYFEDIDKKTKDLLSQFSPLAIAHKGGNSIKHLAISKDAHINYVEADIKSYRGKLSVTHDDNLPPPVIDLGIRLLGIGRSVPLVAKIVEQSLANQQKLLLDLKGESSDSSDHVVKTVDKFGMLGRTAYTGNWTALDRIMKKTGKTSNLFYAIDNESQLFSFMGEQEMRQAQGVSLNFTLAREDTINTLRMRGAQRVFVYGADYSYEILPALEAGADAIITGNFAALELWSNKSREHFLV